MVAEGGDLGGFVEFETLVDAVVGFDGPLFGC